VNAGERDGHCVSSVPLGYTETLPQPTTESTSIVSFFVSLVVSKVWKL
jgi:hypothetical protein